MKLRIEELQKLKGISNVDLAKMIDVSDQQITNYRNGSKKPTFDGLFKLAEALQCEVHELFETSDDFIHNYKGKKWIGIKTRPKNQ